MYSIRKYRSDSDEPRNPSVDVSLFVPFSIRAEH